ncbi:MAG TPA: VWA domain-containing protein [Terriglobales bacterium]|nr:VWA domain-containing protein [Terriglobales bacterium]
MRPLLVLLLVAAGGLSVTPAQAQAPPPAVTQDSDQSTFKVDVRLVNVFATVVDEHGAPVANLQKDNFQVLEDGVPQQIAVFDRESGLPLSIVLAVDTSLSTRKDIKLELESARRFAHSILRPVDALALYQFSEYVDEVIPFTANLREIDRGIEQVRLGAATALYDAIYLGSLTLEDRQGRKVMVVITDGGDTASQTDYAAAVREAQEAEAIVYSIIVVPIEASAGRNTGGEHALIEIARATGGKYYYASSTQDLDSAFRQISDELRTQYLLAYYPKQRVAASDFRQIEVRVLPPSEGEHYVARHRTGYYTSKSH